MTYEQVCAARDRALSTYDALISDASGKRKLTLVSDRATVARDYAAHIAANFPPVMIPVGLVSKLETQYRHGLITRNELRAERWRIARQYNSSTPVSLAK